MMMRRLLVSEHLQDDIRVGAVGEPLLLFGEAADAGVVAFPALHVGDDLEMQMRRPVPILETHAEFGYDLAFRNVLPFVEILQRVEAEMAIEGMKADAFEVMGENDGSAVVAVVVVKGEAVDDTGKRHHDPGAGGSPDVDAEMQTAGFAVEDRGARRFAARAGFGVVDRGPLCRRHQWLVEVGASGI